MSIHWCKNSRQLLLVVKTASLEQNVPWTIVDFSSDFHLDCRATLTLVLVHRQGRQARLATAAAAAALPRPASRLPATPALLHAAGAGLPGAAV